MPPGLLEGIAGRYAKHGYQVYGLPPRYPDLPPSWSGPFPDLLVQKGNERIAFFGAFPQPCRALQRGKRLPIDRSQDSPQRWEEDQLLPAFRNRICAAIQNPGVEVCLFCSSRECPHQSGATDCIYSRYILENIEIRRPQIGGRPANKDSLPSRFMGLTTAQWRAFGLTLIVGLLFTFFLQNRAIPESAGPSRLTYGRSAEVIW